jgi:hypothetical protein
MNPPAPPGVIILNANLFFPAFPFPASHRAPAHLGWKAPLASAIIFAASFAIWSYLITHI